MRDQARLLLTIISWENISYDTIDFSTGSPTRRAMLGVTIGSGYSDDIGTCAKLFFGGVLGSYWSFMSRICFERPFGFVTIMFTVGAYRRVFLDRISSINLSF